MSAGRTMGTVLGRAVAWGVGTSAACFAIAFLVFVFVVPRLIGAQDIEGLTFAVMAGHGGFFIGLLLSLLLQSPAVFALPGWCLGAHLAAIVLAAGTAWETAGVAFEHRAEPATPAETSLSAERVWDSSESRSSGLEDLPQFSQEKPEED